MLGHFSCVRLCVTLWTATAKLFCLWDSPGKKTQMKRHEGQNKKGQHISNRNSGKRECGKGNIFGGNN